MVIQVAGEKEQSHLQQRDHAEYVAIDADVVSQPLATSSLVQELWPFTADARHLRQLSDERCVCAVKPLPEERVGLVRRFQLREAAFDTLPMDEDDREGENAINSKCELERLALVVVKIHRNNSQTRSPRFNLTDERNRHVAERAQTTRLDPDGHVIFVDCGPNGYERSSVAQCHSCIWSLPLEQVLFEPAADVDGRSRQRRSDPSADHLAERRPRHS